MALILLVTKNVFGFGMRVSFCTCGYMAVPEK